MFYSAAKYSVFRTQHPSISLPLCLCLSLCLCLCLSVSLSLCLCVSLSFSLSSSVLSLLSVSAYFSPLSSFSLLILLPNLSSSFSHPLPLRYLVSVSLTSPLWAYVSCLIYIAMTVHTCLLLFCFFCVFGWFHSFFCCLCVCVCFFGGAGGRIWGFLCLFFLPSFYGCLSHSMFIVLLLLCFLLVSFFSSVACRLLWWGFLGLFIASF